MTTSGAEPAGPTDPSGDESEALEPSPPPADGAPQPRRIVRGPRTAARLAAVQALYQMDVAQTDLNVVIAEFLDHRFQLPAAQDVYAGADRAYFARLVRGVVEQQRDIDPAVNAHLANGWRLERLDSTLRAILRAGAFELTAVPDIPQAVALNEWVEVAHAFFAGDERKVVNAVLDRLATNLRETAKGAHGSDPAA